MSYGHYASYDTNYFNLSNSLSYVANTIGSLHVPILVGSVGETPYAVCTVGEWGLRLQHCYRQQFQLDVVSFPKKMIEQIVSVDLDIVPEGKPTRFETFMDCFFKTFEFCDTDVNTIPFLEELYDEFPIRALFDALNAFCDHYLDGKDTDISRPEDIVITASARRFLESRLENNDAAESSLTHPTSENLVLTSDTSILNCNENVNESPAESDTSFSDSTADTNVTSGRSRKPFIPRFRTFSIPKESDWMAFRPSFYPKHDDTQLEVDRFKELLVQVAMISYCFKNTAAEDLLHWSEVAEGALPQRQETQQENQMQRLMEKTAGENSPASFSVNTSTESKRCEAGKHLDTNVLIFCNCTQNGRDVPQNQIESLQFFERQCIHTDKIGQKTVSYWAYGMKNTCKGQLQDVIICLEALSERKNQYLLNVDADVGIQRLWGRYFDTTLSNCFNHFLKEGCQAELYIQGDSFLGQYNNSA